MSKKTEIWWIVFCILLGLLLHVTVELSHPGTFTEDGELLRAEEGSYLQQVFSGYYAFPAPQVFVFLVNFFFLGLKLGATLHPVLRMVGITLTSLTGIVTACAALLMAMEYFFYTDEKTVTEHIFLFPLVLLTGIAIMALMRAGEMARMGRLREIN